MRLLNVSGFILIMASLLAGCNPGKPIDREAVKKQLKSHEIKRVTESEVMLQAEKTGKLIVSANDSVFYSLVTKYNAKVDTIRWDDNVQDSVLNAIKEVYQFAKQDNQSMPSGIQTIYNQVLYFCEPFYEEEEVTGIRILSLPRKEVIYNMQ